MITRNGVLIPLKRVLARDRHKARVCFRFGGGVGVSAGWADPRQAAGSGDDGNRNLLDEVVGVSAAVPRLVDRLAASAAVSCAG